MSQSGVARRSGGDQLYRLRGHTAGIARGEIPLASAIGADNAGSMVASDKNGHANGSKRDSQSWAMHHHAAAPSKPL
jgi:hypothetical protein